MEVLVYLIFKLFFLFKMLPLFSRNSLTENLSYLTFSQWYIKRKLFEWHIQYSLQSLYSNIFWGNVFLLSAYWPVWHLQTDRHLNSFPGSQKDLVLDAKHFLTVSWNMKLVHILSNLLIILVFLLHNYLYIVSLDTSNVLFFFFRYKKTSSLT